ncbi:MAG: hypothetical protein WAP27_10375, partial [Tepidanaerobacteraceae bacterium]
MRKYHPSKNSIENLKIFSRAFSNLSEQRVTIVNQLISAVDQVFPGFTEVFSTVSSKTAIELLVNYSSPDELLNATEEDVVSLIRSCSRRSLEYAEKKYKLLVKCAKDAKDTG